MRDELRLHTPIKVTPEDIEKILAEQRQDESAVADVFEQLRGCAARRAADELNRALELDIFDVLAQGWARVPAVQTAVQLSALTRRPQTLVDLDEHQITSTLRVVVDTHVGQHALPPLRLSLEVLAEIRSATLAASEGRIDLVELGETSVRARLKYKSLLIKEHVTEITDAPRDSSADWPAEPERPATVDFPI